MTIEFKVEKIEEGITKAVVYDVTDGKKVTAGSVRLVEYNDGSFTQIEPFDYDGDKIGTGSKDMEDHIELVKRSYISHLKREKDIDETYRFYKDLADELGVSEELFKKYGNVRGYINNIAFENKVVEKHNTILTQLINHRDSVDSGFKESLPAVKQLITDKIEELKKEISVSEEDIEKHKEWIEGYKVGGGK